MKIVAKYSFKGGEDTVARKYPALLREVTDVIGAVKSELHKTKESFEKTMMAKMLFSPTSLNGAFKQEFASRQWKPVREKCDYPTDYYVDGYKPRGPNAGAFREIDFVKEKLGVEIQFGKYSFMVYNVCAKMTIFKNLGHIDTGIEIVPVKAFSEEMSSGVSYFEQFTWDLKQRGPADIDIPVLILGIDA